MMAGAVVLYCKEVRSGWFENDGHGKFVFHPFPLDGAGGAGQFGTCMRM